LDYFRGARPWPQLFRLLDRLPALSNYGRAVQDDLEVGERLADRGHGTEAAKHRRPDMSGWTELDELLATISDGVNAIRHTVIAVNTQKGKKVPPLVTTKRPLTALERAERRRERQVLDDIVAQATPDYAPRRD
jgi:hypothetical protein